ncbi:MAG TPA: OmpH family outer membrane protein [Verrucomicrobiae bacterium]|nr:OmpH family outer membrane protein [Verrucomicrobiae bacterium]
MRLRSVLIPLALAAAALVPAAAIAQSKIAVISTPVLLREAPQIKAADAKLKGEFEKRETELKAERKKFQDDYKKAQREADAMSPAQKAAAEKDLFSRKSDLDLKERQFTEQVQTRNGELQREVLEKINGAIDSVAKEKGLELVVRDPAFASSSLDITGDVLKKLATIPDTAPAAKKKK